MPVRCAVLALLVVLLGCGGGSASNECSGLEAEECSAPSSPLIVDVAWLVQHLDDPDVQVIDTRASGYEMSRIPGALHLRPGDVAAEVDGVSFQVAPPEQSEPVLRAAGLRNGVTVVVYGGPPEYDSSWLVWVLHYYRHGDVRYLDGGYASWVASGGEIDANPPRVEGSEYAIVGVEPDLVATGEWILSQLGDPPYDAPAIQVVDARAEQEYRSGHIPSAQNVDWTTNLLGGLLLPKSQLDPLYEGLDLTRTTVTYCSTGLRGSFDWLALTALGYEDVRLYDGSWSEWGNGDFPVEE